MACRGSAVRVRLAPLIFFCYISGFQGQFRKAITFVRTCTSLFGQFNTSFRLEEIYLVEDLNKKSL